RERGGLHAPPARRAGGVAGGDRRPGGGRRLHRAGRPADGRRARRALPPRPPRPGADRGRPDRPVPRHRRRPPAGLLRRRADRARQPVLPVRRGGPRPGGAVHPDLRPGRRPRRPAHRLRPGRPDRDHRARPPPLPDRDQPAPRSGRRPRRGVLRPGGGRAVLAGDLFGSITRTVSDPMLLVAEDGEVLGRNAVMRRLFPGAEVGADLYRLAADGPEQVGETLHRWARSGRPLAGSLALIDRDGRPRRCHCFGARASWARTPGPAVQVRLVPVRDADRTTPARGARERRLRARLEHEHAAALRLQRSLLPERVDTTRLRVAVSYAPTARGSEVGGDWYDVFAVSGTAKTGLVIGDVAGHGLAEAAVMAQLRSVVR